MKYLEWNDRLATHFFRPEMAGRSVFLYVTRELLEELGAPTNDTWHDFVSAAKTGHSWRPSRMHNVCRMAIHCLETWRLHNFDYPPYLPYLGLFVLAAGKEGDFAPHAYYPRLRVLLGEAGCGMYPDFDKMHLLWEDLERWANDDMHGDLGLFTARLADSRVHVGVPVAQTVLTERERAALPAVFSAAGLDPTAFPPDPELTRLLLAYGGHHLRRRTLDLLQQGDDESELVSVLLDIIKEELSRWDGQSGSTESVGHESLCGNLRLCCAIVNRVASAARFGLRCSMNRDFPEEGLLLRSTETGETFSCQEEILHWSTEIIDINGHRPIDAAQFTNWEAKLDLREKLFGWRFTLRASPTRIFVDGGSEGLPGIIEVHQLPASGPFYLALSPTARPEVETWGNSCCSGFRPVTIRKGLPPGWSLFWSSGLASGATPCNAYPALCPPSSARLLVRGGIRASRRNWFLPFGLPELVLEAPHGGERVTCAGVELQAANGIYHLPADLPKEQKLHAEACSGGQVIRSHPFYVIGDFTWQWGTPLVSLDRFGAPMDTSPPEGGGAAGASVAGFSPSRVIYSPRPSCFERRRVFFVGREPGQIISWPAEPLPSSWQPVWAIPLERRGRAIFCGTDIAESEPLPTAPGTDRKKLKLWKEVLYHRQKRIGKPLSPRLAQLWKKYQEAARRA
jgi:hypothetical protein